MTTHRELPRRLLASALLILPGSAAHATAPACSGLGIDQPRIMAAPPGAGALAGYGELRNDSATAMTITALQSPAFGSVEVHKMVLDGAEMKMSAEPSLTIPAHGRLAIKPGERHLMLMDPKQILKPGDHVSVQFTCGDGSVNFDFPVQAP